MKTYLKILALTILIGFQTLFSNYLYSQSAGNQNPPVNTTKREKIMAMKIAFISQKIELTTIEAEKFWPIYNEFNAKKDEFAKSKKLLGKEAKKIGIDLLTDQQAEELINAEFKYEQQVLDLKKEYLVKYKAVIGLIRTVKLFNAEKEFNNFLLKQLKESNRSSKQ